MIGIALLVLVVFLIPTEKKNKKMKKKPLPEPETPQRDWEQKTQRLEKHIQSLAREVDRFQKEEKESEKQLMVERVKVKKLQEKLSQEREWHKKGQAGIDKKSREFLAMKSELVKVQDDYSKEHAVNLRQEHRIKELERQVEDLNGQRRSLESKNAMLQAAIESHRRDIAQFKKENAELTKKKEDVNWIAKPEYERVVNLLNLKEKELERMVRETKSKDA